MTNPESARAGSDGPGSEVLGLLADALLGRVDELIAERVGELAPTAAPGPVADRWLKVSEVAERVGSCERTVYRALRSGALVGERLGTRWRIRPAAVDEWLLGSHSAPAEVSRRTPMRLPAPTPPRDRTFTDRARARRGAGPREVNQPPTGARASAKRSRNEQPF